MFATATMCTKTPDLEFLFSTLRFRAFRNSQTTIGSHCQLTSTRITLLGQSSAVNRSSHSTVSNTRKHSMRTVCTGPRANAVLISALFRNIPNKSCIMPAQFPALKRVYYSRNYAGIIYASLAMCLLLLTPPKLLC